MRTQRVWVTSGARPIPSFFPFQNYLFHRAKANAPVRKNYAAQLRQLISRLKADVPRAQNQYDKVKPYLSKNALGE